MSVAFRHTFPEASLPEVAPVGVRLAPLWVVVVFSNVPVYIFTFILPSLVPLYWLGALFVLSFLALTGAPAAGRERAPVFLAVLAAYAFICLAWYVAHGGGDPVLLRQRLLSIGVCGAAYLIFASSAAALRAARRTLAVMVVLAVAVNAWDITHPFALIPADSEFSIVGRAAGFFINPNQAGAALVAGFTLSVGVVPRRWRASYLVLVAIGTVLTFSRAAILGLALVSIALVLRGRSLSWRQLAGALIILAGLAWITWLIVSAELQQRFHIDPDVALDRLLWIFDPSGRSDFSEWERIALLERGWEQFLASPWVGNGLGSTELWEARSSTHNMYVMLASDFGVIGLFILPAIVLAAVGMRGSPLSDAAVAGLFLLFWGFFSHNILSEYYLLLTISLIAALRRRETWAERDTPAEYLPAEHDSRRAIGSGRLSTALPERRELPVGHQSAHGLAAYPAEKIVIVVGSLARGGAERVATTLANAWAQQGREVWLVATYLGERTAAYQLHPRVALVWLSELMGRVCALRAVAGMRKGLALRRFIQRVRPDAVVSLLTNVNVLSIVALAGLRWPLIVSERTDPAGDPDLHWLFRLVRGRAYRSARALVVQTKAAARRWAERLPGMQRIEIIPNPLSGELETSRLRAVQSEAGGLVIAMGRLGREKGFAGLLSAFKMGLGEDVSWGLQIWGEGPLEAELARRVEELGLKGRVSLCGSTTDPWTVLGSAQIFVLSSEYEGFPNAMLEAMAVGLPCIAYDCPSGPQELADSGAAAIMIPAGDIDRLARALRELAADREARRALGERAAAYVRREFSESKVIAAWDRLFAELLPAERRLIAPSEG